MAMKNTDMIEMQIDALVKAGYYSSISDITKKQKDLKNGKRSI